MNNGQDKTALITGATSGIGKELALVFAVEGYELIIVAREEGDLEAVAAELRAHGVRVHPLAKDLSQPGAAEELYAEVRARGHEIDVLVNDAGQGEFGPFLSVDLARHLEIIRLNLISLTALTHLFGRDMVARGSGRILQLASIVSKMPSPLLGVYAATKAYVYSLSQALANELKDTGVTVTALMPGATDTFFFARAGDEEWEEHREGLADPAKVARDGYEALMAGTTHVVSGASNKARNAMSAVLPDATVAEMARKENEPRVN